MGTNEKVEMARAVGTLLSAFGQKDSERIAIYSQVLRSKGYTPDMVKIATMKLLDECTFVPSIAEITKAIKSLQNTVNDKNRVLDWSEAWAIIKREMTRSGEHNFERKEVEQTVNRFGWSNICNSLEKDLPFIQAQLRQMYEVICKRNEENEENNLLLQSPKAREAIMGSMKMLADKMGSG